MSGLEVGKSGGASLVGAASLGTVLEISTRVVAGADKFVGVSTRNGDGLIGVPSLRVCMAALIDAPSLRTGAPVSGVAFSGVTSLRVDADREAMMGEG